MCVKRLQKCRPDLLRGGMKVIFNRDIGIQGMYRADEYDTDKTEQRKGDRIRQIVLISPDHKFRRRMDNKMKGRGNGNGWRFGTREKIVVQPPFRKRNTISNARLMSLIPHRADETL